MSSKPYWYLICTHILMLTACAVQRSTGDPLATAQQVSTQSVAATLPNNPAATCPITDPPNPPFTPPAPYPATPPSNYAGAFWYGTRELWTMLAADGVWSALPQSANGYTQKIAWWRQGYNPKLEPAPKLMITGKRLDTPAPPLLASNATNASGGFGDAMMVGIEIPTLGCWEITGQYNGYILSFVVWVAP